MSDQINEKELPNLRQLKKGEYSVTETETATETEPATVVETVLETEITSETQTEPGI